jgi:hypothetical protein
VVSNLCGFHHHFGPARLHAERVIRDGMARFSSELYRTRYYSIGQFPGALPCSPVLRLPQRTIAGKRKLAYPVVGSRAFEDNTTNGSGIIAVSRAL